LLRSQAESLLQKPKSSAQRRSREVKRFRLAAQQGNASPGKKRRDRLVRLAAARNEARAKAEKGDAQAQFDLGWMYDEGKSVEQDSAEAAKWYREAASRGQKRAQFKLGFMYSTGGASSGTTSKRSNG